MQREQALGEVAVVVEDARCATDRPGERGAPQPAVDEVAGGIDVVKVLDFGLAKFLEVDELSQDATLTRKGRIVGTPAYMAPEQITGVSLDVRADVYAAGVVLYEMLADQRPFSYERRSQLLRAHLFEPVPSIERMRPGLHVHPELEQLILRALEKDPTRRFNDGGEMLQALQALPDEPASFEEQRRDQVRSRTGSSSAVILSAEEREAVSQGLDDTGSMSMETVQVAMDSAPTSPPRRPVDIPDTLSGLTGVSVPGRGARVPAGTTSSHPRPGTRVRRKKRRAKGPPAWLWVVTVASVLVSGAIYWWTQLHGGTLP